MKLDTTKKGQKAIFKEYQTIAIEKLQDGETMTSGTMHIHVNTILAETKQSISRASIIFFLNDLVDDGILTYESKTGKGGYHRVYEMAQTREGFAHKLIGTFVAKLQEAFPEGSKTFKWPRP